MRYKMLSESHPQGSTLLFHNSRLDWGAWVLIGTTRDDDSLAVVDTSFHRTICMEGEGTWAMSVYLI